MKVKDEIFNFGCQFSNLGSDSHNVDDLLKYLNSGKKIKILANKDDIIYISENNLKQKIINFFREINNEVEVYKLTIDNN